MSWVSEAATQIQPRGLARRTERPPSSCTRTTDPLFGACTMACPAPRYIITCPGYCTRSAGSAVSHERGADSLIWVLSRCASATPTVLHAYIVRPEQSKPLPGFDAREWYGTPACSRADRSTVIRVGSVAAHTEAKASAGVAVRSATIPASWLRSAR